MTKLIRFTQSYLIFALPFVLICMAWSTIQSGDASTSVVVRALWELLSWNLMLWFVVLILFLGLLVASPVAREKTLKRLANLRERDEREQYITGQASRAAYISTLSLLIFFLFFSMFTVKIYRLPESEAVHGKTGTLSIGTQMNLLDSPRVATNSAGQVLFESKDIPLSKTAILLILLTWQLLTFNFAAKREQEV